MNTRPAPVGQGASKGSRTSASSRCMEIFLKSPWLRLTSTAESGFLLNIQIRTFSPCKTYNKVHVCANSSISLVWVVQTISHDITQPCTHTHTHANTQSHKHTKVSLKSLPCRRKWNVNLNGRGTFIRCICQLTNGTRSCSFAVVGAFLQQTSVIYQANSMNCTVLKWCSFKSFKHTLLYCSFSLTKLRLSGWTISASSAGRPHGCKAQVGSTLRQAKQP